MAKRKRIDDFLLLIPGERVEGDHVSYVVDRVVGTGAFAAVYSAHDESVPGRHVALKEFFLPQTPKEQKALMELFERERIVGMQASPHPLMPTFYQAFRFDGHFYIAQEFIEGTTLDEIIFKRHPIPKEWILKWAVYLCDALAFLHSRQIIHHDIKPANIRVTQKGHLILLDFGAARYFGAGHDDKPPADLYGTEGYLPPEVTSDGNWSADVRTDIFAVGCTLFEMIAGTAPDQTKIDERSAYVTNFLLQKPNADLNLVKLINKAMSYNSDFRYGTANDFLRDIRKLTPPVLLVTRKHLRYGEVKLGQQVASQKITLYNAGGGELQGEVKPRAPWIVANETSFKGNRRNIEVSVDTNQIKERGELVTGRLEINSRDIRDADNNIIGAGDRWFVECTITVERMAGRVSVVELERNNGVPITMAAKKGDIAVTGFSLKNDGDFKIDYHAVHDGPKPDGITSKDVIIHPVSGTIQPHQIVNIAVHIETKDFTIGTHQLQAVIKTTTDQDLKVPLILQIRSASENLKALIKKYW